MDLPAPRLELRWRKPTPIELKHEHALWGQYNWTCEYNLVLPLRESDCRREGKNHKEKKYELGKTYMSTGINEPPRETPVRDGAHAGWDSEALKDIPVILIHGDGSIKQVR